MTEKELHAYYTTAVLPQFGIDARHARWKGCKRIGFDELAHHFHVGGHAFVLIFEDYADLGRSPEFVERTLGFSENEFEYVEPKSHTSSAPSYGGFHPPTPYKYVEGVTGTFTLLKLKDPQGLSPR